ncbi:MAG: hypothetical protein AAGA77_19100, partial [Bacteroidota bacterium]
MDNSKTLKKELEYMNNFYFYSKRLIKVLEKNEEILNLIISIEEQRSDYILKPQEIINIGITSNERIAGIGKLQQNIESKNREILSLVRSVRPNKVYDQINTLLYDLNLFDNSYNNENELVKNLKAFPDHHTDAYSEKESE